MDHFRRIDISDMAPAQPVTEPAPALVMVEIDHLVIDDRYQRPLQAGNWLAIKRIAGDFRWPRFSPVIVAPIEGGRYALVDGQHRAHAAALCGIRSIPAMVAQIAPEEQARAFIEINARQIRVTGHQVYRAALTSGERWALECRDAVEAAGCKLMTATTGTKDKKPGQVFAIGLIRKMVAAGQGKAVTDGLRAMRDYEPESVANMADALLAPWLGAVAETGAAVPQLVTALHERRPWLVIAAADRMAEEDRKPKASARREFFAAMIRRVQREGAA